MTDLLVPRCLNDYAR